MTNELIHQIIWIWVYAGVGAALFTLAIFFLAMIQMNRDKKE